MANGVTQKLLGQTGPIDRVAARVVRKASREDLWEPKRFVNELTVDVQPLLLGARDRMAFLAAKTNDKTDYSGLTMGALKIIGLGRNGNVLRWVARCDCGMYVFRQTSACRRYLENPPGSAPCCPRCVAKRKIKGIVD